MEKYQPQPLFNVETGYKEEVKHLFKDLKNQKEVYKREGFYSEVAKDNHGVIHMSISDGYAERLYLEDDNKEIKIDIDCGYLCEIRYDRKEKRYEHIIEDYDDYDYKPLSRWYYLEGYSKNKEGKESYDVTAKYYLGSIGEKEVFLVSKASKKRGKTTKQYFISHQDKNYEIGYNELPVDGSPICMAILEKVKPSCIEYLNDEYGYECTINDSLVELVDEKLYNGAEDIVCMNEDSIDYFLRNMSDNIYGIINKVVYNKESDWVTDPYFNGYYERLDDGDDYDYRDDDDDDRPMTEDEYYDAVAEGEIDEGWDGGMFRR